MTKEEILAMITEIGTEADDLKRRSLLTELGDSVSSLYDTNETMTKDMELLNSNLEKVNGELKDAQEYNMQLFKRVNAQNKSEGFNQEDLGIEKEPEKRKFEDLFKEGGEK